MNHGLFDLQVNGFAGVDFQRPEITHADLERAAEALSILLRVFRQLGSQKSKRQADE